MLKPAGIKLTKNQCEHSKTYVSVVELPSFDWQLPVQVLLDCWPLQFHSVHSCSFWEKEIFLAISKCISITIAAKSKSKSTKFFTFDTFAVRLLFENFVHFVALVGLAEPAGLVVEMFAVDIECSLENYDPTGMIRSTDEFVAVVGAAVLATIPDKFGVFVWLVAVVPS